VPILVVGQRRTSSWIICACAEVSVCGADASADGKHLPCAHSCCLARCASVLRFGAERTSKHRAIPGSRPGAKKRCVARCAACPWSPSAPERASSQPQASNYGAPDLLTLCSNMPSALTVSSALESALVAHCLADFALVLADCGKLPASRSCRETAARTTLWYRETRRGVGTGQRRSGASGRARSSVCPSRSFSKERPSPLALTKPARISVSFSS